MRILLVSHAWFPESRGGTELHARDAGFGLAARGHIVGVFCRTGDPSLGEYEVRTGQDGPLGLTRIKNGYRDFQDFEWLYRNREIHEAFVRELDEFKPDLVHIHHLAGLTSTIIEELKTRAIPTVMTLHDFWMVCPRGQRMRESLDLCEDIDRETCFKCLRGLWPHLFGPREDFRTIVDLRGRLSPLPLAEFDRHMVYALNLCDTLITPSEFHRERMLDFPLSAERIIALPHGLDTSRLQNRSAERSRRKPRKIGFIGSMIPVKGVHVLIEAFRKTPGEDLELHLHGEAPPFHGDDQYGQRLKAIASGDPRIHFHGAYGPADLERLLAPLDALVVPSLWWETFCLTIREGFLAGVPVIASDIGAMREALDGEEGGLFFKAGDAEDLADKLARFLGDHDLRERLQTAGGVVKPMDAYLRELEQIYLQTIAVSGQRAKQLVVAPPAFPKAIAPPPAAEPAPIPIESTPAPVAEPADASAAHASEALNAPAEAERPSAPRGASRRQRERLARLAQAAEPGGEPPRLEEAVKPTRPTLPTLETRPTEPTIATRATEPARLTLEAKPEIPKEEAQAERPVQAEKELAKAPPIASGLPVQKRDRDPLPRELRATEPLPLPAERLEKKRRLTAFLREEISLESVPVAATQFQRKARVKREACPQSPPQQKVMIQPIDLPLVRRVPTRKAKAQRIDIRTDGDDAET